MKKYWILPAPIILLYLIMWKNIGRNSTLPSRNFTAGEHTAKEITRGVKTVKEAEQMKTATYDPHADALLSGKRPLNKTFLTLAIPTISRPLGTVYIESTLNSLIENSGDAERKDMRIVILLADFNETLRLDLNQRLVGKYGKHFDSGLIQTIQAPRSFYPSFENLKRTYNHEISRVKWRSKQNFDYAFLMEYCEPLSDYYLQLEDDIITVPEYISVIKNYISSIYSWTCLEFCEMGFIAKLYHNYDLRKLFQMLKVFYNEQPCDVIYLHFNELMLQFRRFVHRPTIFQHKGYVSSMGLSRIMMEDILFDDKQNSVTKSPQQPVEIRQIGRVPGPEQVVWAKRRQEEIKLGKTIEKFPNGTKNKG